MKAAEADVNHRLHVIPVQIVHNYQNLNCYNAKAVYQSNYNFGFAHVCFGDDEVDLKCQMDCIQTNQQIDLDYSRQSVSQTQSKEYFTVVVENVVDVGDWLAQRIILQ